MSIFGRGYPYTELSKIGRLDINSIPSNMKLKGISDYKNVLSRAHLKMMLQDIKSELAVVFSAILGFNLQDIELFTNIDINRWLREDNSNTNCPKSSIFIDETTHKMYIKPTSHNVIQPYSLATEAMGHLRKSEYEAVYYCKYDTLGVQSTTYNVEELARIDESREYYKSVFTEYDHPLRNKHYWGEINQAKDITHRDSLYGRLLRRPIKENYDIDSIVAEHIANTVTIPNVRINTWKIPLYTDKCMTADIFIDGLDVQIDFMPNPFEHLDENSISNINGVTITGNELHRHKLIYNEYSWNTGTFHTAFLKENPVSNQKVLMNKRPTRHMRYKLSFAKSFPNRDYTYNNSADYIQVEKIYDTEADLPMSRGFALYPEPVHQFGGKWLQQTSNIELWAHPTAEGIGPDPEDLTNPMDLAVDFMFVGGTTSEGTSGPGLAPEIHPQPSRKIRDKDLYLLGFLVIKGYSGLVGSTLLNGNFDWYTKFVDGVTDGYNEATTTSYSRATRPHDTFFKVTLRVPKGIPIAGGRYVEPDSMYSNNGRPSFSERVKPNMTAELTPANIILEPTTLALSRMSEHEHHKVKGWIYPILAEPSSGFYYDSIDTRLPNTYQDGLYSVTEYKWGSPEFYTHRIMDRGGFLRMPIQDWIWWYDTWYGRAKKYPKYRNYYGTGIHMKTVSGYMNPLTSFLDYYYYKTDPERSQWLKNKNVGGQKFE